MEQDSKFNKIVSWSQDRVMELINHWRDYECLYNPSHTLYSNKNARQNALESITQQLRMSMPQLTINDVKTKMNYLRSQYCREMHKYPLDDKYKTTHEADYKCYPYWFENLSFVKKFVRVRRTKRERTENNQLNFTSSNDEISSDNMPMPIKHPRSNDMSSTSTTHSEEAGMCLYKPDPDILELFHRQLASLTNTQPDTNSKSQQPTTTNQQPHSSSNPSTINITSTDNEYEQTFMSFIKMNLALITDLVLKDELLDKITMLLLEYKGKQRTLDKC